MTWLPLVFFAIAFFYSMVGFGGGSSYLAVLVLAGLSYDQVPPVALLCNLVVTAGASWHFYRAGHLRWPTVLPFAVASIPLAYLGGRTTISETQFCLLLGLSLLVAAARLLLGRRPVEPVWQLNWSQAWLLGIPIGAGLGFLAGLVGIGGGIFLSPLLLLLRWVNVKQAAAAASVFIVLNSAAGLLGHLQKGSGISLSLLLPLGLVVLLGGQLGSRIGAYRVPMPRLQQVVGVLILYVSLRLLVRGVG